MVTSRDSACGCHIGTVDDRDHLGAEWELSPRWQLQCRISRPHRWIDASSGNLYSLECDIRSDPWAYRYRDAIIGRIHYDDRKHIHNRSLVRIDHKMRGCRNDCNAISGGVCGGHGRSVFVP
jgi:hypothetical protein